MGFLNFILITCIIILFLCGLVLIPLKIKEMQEKAETKRNKRVGIWEIPHSKLLEYCAYYGVVNIDSEQNYKRSLEFVKKILISEEVPEDQHNKYLNRDRIQRYFDTMRSSDDWANTLVAKRARTCYEECRKANALPPFTTATRQKATLIADNYFTDFDLDPIIEEGERLVNAEQYAKKLEKQNQEREKQKELVKYGNLHGREKSMAMLVDLYRKPKQELAELENTLEEIAAKEGKLYKKERSWSVAGGIADALAGPAAGVATAIDVQNQNASIRAYNQDTARMVGNAYAYLEHQIAEKKKYMERINDLYLTAKTLLIDEQMSSKACFQKLIFTNPNVMVSDVGTATVTVSAKATPFTIFDDRKADIDGSVIAHVLDGETEVGQALMVFPRGGTAKGICSLKGMALFCCQKGKNYSVTFSPNDLWAIEHSSYIEPKDNSLGS